MSESEMTSQPLSQPPSLVLVAPKPRRPIALVSRKHHHRHTTSQSHSRSSRSGTKAPTQSTEEAKDPMERVASPSTVRMIGHPYPRAKTPSNANASSSAVSSAAAALAGVTGWPLGLGISPVSPPPRSKTSSRESMTARPLSRLSPKDGATIPASLIQASAESATKLASVLDDVASRSLIDAKVTDTASHADELMPASPPLQSRATSMDVERTPTKSNGHIQHSLVIAASSLGSSDDNQEPRSTPTIGASSPRQADGVNGLTLSPTSPTAQRITAAASASAAQLPLPLSSPPTLPAAVASSVDTLTRESPRRADLTLASASVAPSPCLSESHSRSPSASPSPCPSPGFGTLLDVHIPPKHAGEPRKMGLPPLPTSPIPRKMTRNPFERYLSVHAARDSCTFQARLSMAMAGQRPRSVLEAMERQISHDMARMDEEMAGVGISSPSSVHRPTLLSVNSRGGAKRMDIED